MGHDHELLEVNRGIGVSTAVDDIGHGNGKNLGVRSANVLEERLSKRGCGGLGGREGNGEDGVGTKAGFGFGSVELQHGLIDIELIKRVHTFQSRGDGFGNMMDGFGNALTEVTGLIAIPKFNGFMFACTGTARDGCSAGDAAIEDDIGFHRRIPS